MTQPVEKLAILFADICGSTALYESLGDSLARQLVAQCLNAMVDELPTYQGTLIKTIGDEILCVFPSGEAAFHAACAMQIAVESMRVLNNHPLHIRIGFHYGDVIRESGDVFGDTVNTAARVASITRADQIMTTLAVADVLPSPLRKKTRHIQRAELKGKQEHFDIFMVIWELDDMLSTRIVAPTVRFSPDASDEMILRYHDQVIKINKTRRNVMAGRGKTCDIVVSNNLASRQHIHIELRFGKFIIVDQSTNGTYIRFNDGNVVHITREETVLQGNGSISLGHSYAENPTELIEFSIGSFPVQS